jgi:hypothetical protein
MQGAGFEPHFNIKKVYVSPVEIKKVQGKGFEPKITGENILFLLLMIDR